MLKLGKTYMALKYPNQPLKGFNNEMIIQGILLSDILSCPH